MKHLSLTITALAVTLLLPAQRKIDDIIKMNASDYSFGRIRQNTPVSYYFEITNISNGPVEVENAWGSCGCTIPEVPHAPIAPGKTSKLKVQYSAPGVGRFEKDVYLKFKGVETLKIIRIRGEVIAG